VPRSSRLQRRDAGDTAPSDALIQKLDQMQPTHVLAFLCLTALNPAFGMDAGKIAMAAKSLAPNVLWQEKSVLKGDLTCQARQDFAILGTQGSLVKVAVFAQGATARPMILDIDSDLLATQTTMSIESQDFETGTGQPGDVGPLPGFKRSKTCKGLKLDDDRIDSVHIYWNRIEGRFQTWQR
jgi:hypothetical protein